MTSRNQLTFCLALVSMVVIYYIAALQLTECAPNSNSNKNNDNSNNNNNRIIRPGLLSNLFRRQTNSNNSNNSNNNNSNNNENSNADSDDPVSETEREAQKFMNSLPNVNGNNNAGPASFRERVSDTWGVLRDGVSNQFRSLRDNWSETVEDLRDTWTGNSSE